MGELAITLSDADIERIADAIARRIAAVARPASRPPAHLTVSEVARELRQSERSVRRLVATGRLQAAKTMQGGSSRVLVSRASLDALLGQLR